MPRSRPGARAAARSGARVRDGAAPDHAALRRTSVYAAPRWPGPAHVARPRVRLGDPRVVGVAPVPEPATHRGGRRRSGGHRNRGRERRDERPRRSARAPHRWPRRARDRGALRGDRGEHPPLGVDPDRGRARPPPRARRAPHVERHPPRRGRERGAGLPRGGLDPPQSDSRTRRMERSGSRATDRVAMTSRVFANAPLVPGGVIELGPQESHCLVRVRRVRPGAAVEVFDGHVGGCSGTLLDASVGACRVRLEAALAFPDVPAIELGVALIDPKAALDVVARACEGGAVALTWLQTARSFNAAPSAARLERVLRAAQRQCGRPTPPRILGPVTLADWLAEATDRPTWFAAEHE